MSQKKKKRKVAVETPKAATKSTTSTPANWLKFGKWIAFVFGFALYANTLSNGYTLDDHAVILKNTYVQEGIGGMGKILTTNYLNGFDGFNDGLYRPLSPLMFAFEVGVLGGGPAIHHFFNVLLYGLTGLLLVIFFQGLFNGRHPLLPLVATLIFLAHPIHTDAVSGIKGRDEILALLNAVAAGIFMLRFLKAGKEGPFLLAMLFFILSLLSKESAVSMLVALPLVLYFFGPSELKRLAQLGGGMLLLSAFFMGMRSYIIDSMPREVDQGVFGLLNNSLAGADGAMERLGSVLNLQTHYLYKLLLPVSLSHDYSYNQIPVVSLFSLEGLLGLFLVGGLAALGIWGWKKKHYLGFFAWFYGSTMAVTSNLFFLTGVTIAERLLYVASLGFAILVAFLLLEWRSGSVPTSINFGRWFKSNPLRAGILLLLLGFYSIQTISRNSDWKDNRTLYAVDVLKVPNSARANYNHGTALQNEATDGGNARQVLLTESVEHLSKAVSLYPDYLDAWNNLGTSLMHLKRFDEAEKAYQRIIAMEPTYSRAYYNLAVTFFKQQKYTETIRQMEYYNQIKPGNVQACFILGSSYGNLGQFEKALEILQVGNRLDPQNADILLNLGQAYGILGRLPEAREVLLEATKMHPNQIDFWINLGITNRELGKVGEAVKCLQNAVNINPNDARARQLLQQMSAEQQ